MQSFDGATWPPGSQCEFLGIASIAADGTLEFSSNLANGQPVVSSVGHPTDGNYVIHVNVRPGNGVPYALVIPIGSSSVFRHITNNANPDASVTLESNAGETDAHFLAFIFATVPPVTVPIT